MTRNNRLLAAWFGYTRIDHIYSVRFSPNTFLIYNKYIYSLCVAGQLRPNHTMGYKSPWGPETMRRLTNDNMQ